MNTVESSTNEIANRTRPTEENSAAGEFYLGRNAVNPSETAFGLGVWLSGLESFLHLRGGAAAGAAEENSVASIWTKEFGLTYLVLLSCSKSALDLAKNIHRDSKAEAGRDEIEILDNSGNRRAEAIVSFDELHELILALKESVLLSEGLLRAYPLKFNQWRAWSGVLSERLKNAAAAGKLIRYAEQEGEAFLPETLRALLSDRTRTSEFTADLKLILPRIAITLKWLSVVREMLERDEPLKTSLLLFARINVQMQETMALMNNRLLRFDDEEDDLFNSLDGAAYTASIELRKVYDQELKGLTEIRPTPLIYAKIETAYSLLNDSLQSTLVNFAQLLDASLEPVDLFPNLLKKEKQSILLRDNMWDVLQSVKEVEQAPEADSIAELNEKLVDFRDESLSFLFYKDMETVERFIEEILITKDKKDLVPILHRFGAYLETLLGQVNMRVVLAKHPFEPLRKEAHEMFV